MSRSIAQQCTALSLTLLFVSLASAERPPHPEPRVIVNVTAVRGPHVAAQVQRSARFGWGRIIRCYKSIDKKAKGKLTTELGVSSNGRVTTARQKRSTLKSDELSRCLLKAMQGLEMPKASGSSTATVEISVAPGDAA